MPNFVQLVKGYQLLVCVFICFCFTISCSLGPAHAETAQLPSLTYETITVPSESLQVSRPILVHLPKDYSSPQNTTAYPVLFVLNRSENFAISSQVVEFLSSKGNIPRMIVVGVPHMGSSNWKDEYIPYEEGVRQVSADRFLGFLTTELIPFIDQAYRTLPSRILVGHSLAGLFTTHAYLEAPGSFNAFIALSPSFHHSKDILSVARQKLESGEQRPDQVLFMSIGSEEYYRIRNEYNRMGAVLSGTAPSNLRWYFEQAKNSSHRSMPLAGLLDGLATVFEGYNLSLPQFRLQGYKGVVAHYTSLSNEMGSELRPDRGDLEGFLDYFKSPDRASDPDVARDAARYVLDAKRLLAHFYP